MIAISGVTEINPELYDEIWYVTNNTPNIRVGAKHHPELAPNRADYTSFRRNQISLATLLDRYEYDLRNNRLSELNALIEESDSGKWIQCVCYCDSYTLCHRGVLYMVLSEMTDHIELLS